MAKRGNFSSVFCRRFFLIFRSVICAILILALSGMTVAKTAEYTTTIFAVDLSASAKQSQADALKFLQEAEKARGEKEKTGVICFATEAVVEQSPMTEIALPESFFSFVKENGTNISSALALGASMIPENTRKRIVLLSDGIETTSDALEQAKLLQAQEISVDVVALQPEEKKEVQLSGLKMSSVINKNTAYDITVQISSNIDTSAELKLFKGNYLIAQEQIEITKGESNVVFTDKADIGGSIIYRAEITAKEDTLPQNNKAYGYCYITDIPKILLIEQNASGAVWADFLKNSQVDVTRVSSESAPVTVEQLNQYDSVIIANTAATQMPKGFLEALESYVKTTGGGLLVTGGENAYALGEYYNTKLEEILPVDMQLRTEGENNSLGMIMVVDRSGSMDGGEYGVSKIEMAKEACIRSLSSFMPGDFVGVLAFDDIGTWAVPFQNVQDNLEDIRIGIGNIQPGGGTSILPALREAYQTLKEADTKQKHILLLTDGEAEKTGYDGLLAQMNESGITLSTVAVGKGADTQLLTSLAQKGKGRYYFTSEFTDLPEIFAKETLLASKQYINNRTFYPRQNQASAILAEIDAIAPLDGYVGTTAKQRADVVLESDKKEPILATWQYGLGRTVAWTSDMEGKWSGKWLQSPSGREIIQNMISWVMKKQSGKQVQTEAEIVGEKSRLTVTMEYDESIRSIKGTVVSSSNENYDVTLDMTAPGVYTAMMDTNEEGGYILNLQTTNENGETELINTGFSIDYPKEYDRRNWGKGTALLNRIAQTTNGRILTTGSDVFIDEARAVTDTRNLTTLLLILAFVLFLLDVFFHRFYVVTQKIEAVWKQYFQTWKGKKEKKNILQKQKSQFQKKLEQAKQKQEKQYKKQTDIKMSQQQNTAVQLADAKKKRKR